MNTTINMRFASKKNKDLSNDGVDKMFIESLIVE